ncbi:cysteine synthase A [Microaceticoccus formicicus]|uniref:cysteine synthase A n=1 Tax=Microaceticoccus formicicus TaxID=3118105 RepID=UPI003CD01734|nr:cysteine synthase A [Peptoniphilaceae bacterium AMB_02]
MIYKNVTEIIGNTPMVRLNSLGTNGVEILVKIESRNPGGSIKDRAALKMIQDAEDSGVLKPGGVIIEPTSGNTGIALAMVGAIRGYKVLLVMPETMSIERRKLIMAYGAEILLTPGEEGMIGSVKLAEKLSKENDYYMPYQFENTSNREAHIQYTAMEILRDTKGDIDAFVAGVGTGGTISGVGKRLKEVVSGIKIIAVEPEKSKVLRGAKPNPHGIQGIGANFVPAIYDAAVVGEVVGVKDEDAFETARELAKKEGILCGISSGANVYAAIELSKNMMKGSRIVTVLPDTGERYLSTELFGE